MGRFTSKWSQTCNQKSFGTVVVIFHSYACQRAAVAWTGQNTLTEATWEHAHYYADHDRYHWASVVFAHCRLHHHLLCFTRGPVVMVQCRLPPGSTCRKSDCRLLLLSCSTPSSLGFLLPGSRQRAGSSSLLPVSLPSGPPPVVVLNAPLHEVGVRKSRLRLRHQLCTSEPAFCFFFIPSPSWHICL